MSLSERGKRNPTGRWWPQYAQLDLMKRGTANDAEQLHSRSAMHSVLLHTGNKTCRFRDSDGANQSASGPGDMV